MKLGLNLSFAIKRWLGGSQLADIVGSELGFDCAQLTWDLINPDWPAATRDRIAIDYAQAFERSGIAIESTFGGVASYTYNNYLAPTADLRHLGHVHLLHAIDTTSVMGIKSTGMPFGSFSAADALSLSRRSEIYKEALDLLVDAARHAKRRGLDLLLIEPTPLATEFPSSASESARMMNDLRGQTDVPIRLLVDWGHALFEPLFGKDADMDFWMKMCGTDIAAFHIQQTDGTLDRHWSFSKDGLVTRDLLEDFWNRHRLTTQTYFLEIIYPFEDTDESVLIDMKAGIARLRPEYLGNLG